MRRTSRSRLSNFERSKMLCPDLPWCNDEPERLGPVIMDYLYDTEAYIRRWAQRWFENFQFVYGNSTLKWSRSFDFAVDTDFLRSGNVAINQRAFTNIARTVAESIGAFLYNNMPDWDAETAEESSKKGRRYAKIIEKLLDAYMVRLCMDKEFTASIWSFIVYNQVAARIDWKTRSGTSLDIPQFQKIKGPSYTDYMAPNPLTGGAFEVPVPSLDSGGMPFFNDRWEPVYGPDGKQQVIKTRSGDVSFRTLTPFQYRRQIGSIGMHDTKFAQEIRLMDYDEFLNEYGDLGGKTRHFEHVTPGYSNRAMWGFAVAQFMRMSFTCPPTIEDGGGMRRMNSILKGSMFRRKVLVVDHFDAPNDEKWEEGRRVVVVNGQCTNVTIPQYFTNKLDGWHPFVEAQWMAVPPSSNATGALDGVTSKNRELNLYDSLIATSARRNMGSQLLVKSGSGFDPNKMSGEPGQAHVVNDLDAAKYLHDDKPVPPVIGNLRAQIKDDVYESSGAQDAIRGDRSQGASSGYAYRVLQEREERRLAPLRTKIEQFAAGAGEKIICCLHQNCIKLDDNIMGYMTRHAAGGFQPSDVVSFLSSPIDYGVDVRVIPGSMHVKSKASQQASMADIAKGPGRMRLEQDAEVLDRYLKFMDADRLRDDSSYHRDRAERENDQFQDIAKMGPDSGGIPRPIVLFEDDDGIHLSKHTSFLLENSDEIMRDELYLKEMLLHMERHRIQRQEKEGTMMPGANLMAPQMMRAASQQPPPGVPNMAAWQQMQQVMAQNRPQQAQQAQQQPQQGQEQPQPTAPKQSATEPGAPSGGQTDASAPSSNTAQGQRGDRNVQQPAV